MPKKKVTEAVEETAQETIPVEKAPAQMPRRQGSEDLLELNDLERGVTREDITPTKISTRTKSISIGPTWTLATSSTMTRSLFRFYMKPMRIISQT